MEEELDIEILDFAVSREAKAYYFYMTLSRMQTDVGLTDIFKSLADDELEHKAKLELEIIKLGRVVKTAKNWPRFDETYPPNEPRDQDQMTYKDALEIAIRNTLEDESPVFVVIGSAWVFCDDAREQPDACAFVSKERILGHCGKAEVDEAIHDNVTT